MALVEFEQAANVTILTQEDCQNRFTGYKIHPTMLCAGGGETDACQVIKFTKTMISNKIFRKFLALVTIEFFTRVIRVVRLCVTTQEKPFLLE